MSRIVSLEPIVIRIEYNEVTGGCQFHPPSRPIAFPVLVKLLSQVLNILADQFMTQTTQFLKGGEPDGGTKQ